MMHDVNFLERHRLYSTVVNYKRKINFISALNTKLLGFNAEIVYRLWGILFETLGEKKNVWVISGHVDIT